MHNVANRKIISRLSFRSLKAARLRNIMAVCAIALTAVLFTTLFTLGIGTIDAFQQATMRQSGGSGHAAVKYIDDETFEKISAHPLVKEISYNRMLADSVDNPGLLKRHGELWYMDDAGLRQGFCEPTTGNRPIAENEIILDTKAMQLLNIPQEIGAPVTLTFTVKGEQVERCFVLSGWWESDPVFNVSMLITSKAYVETHIKELSNTYREDYFLAGVINAYIMFYNTFNMQKKLDRVITESGFSIADPDSPKYLESNLNWAYLSAGMGGDPITTGLLIAAALLVALTGYLIIYNIFQISVLRDIRFYGLLKTIGTTSRQINRIIRRQAAALSIIGIPIGLALGFIIGKSLVPVLVAQTIHAGSAVVVPANPLIFIGAAAFAAVTVWISVRKPGKVAASVSPVEAVRYTDVDSHDRKKEKRSTDGGKLIKMAMSNLGRNRKRTLLTLLSLSLSLVLLNCVFTISRGLDMDKYLSTFVDNDFLVAHAGYFKNDYYNAELTVDEQVIEDMESLPGFESGGRFYFTINDRFTVEDSSYDKPYREEDGHPTAFVYGLDDLPLSCMEVYEGVIDAEKLKSGGYILVGVHTDDFNRPMPETIRFDVGEKVVLHNRHIITLEPYEAEYTTQEYEVMALVIVKTFTNTNRWWSEYTFFLPANVYLPLSYEKAIMSYTFNAADDMEAEIEVFLKNYTETEQPLMSYESKAVKVEEFDGMRLLLLSVGGVLSGIIGFIGILNFINSMLTSILTRRCEFAMMQSIGMTGRQLRNMLCMEGLYYAGGTVAFSLILGILTSLFVIRNLMGGLWFVTYSFVILPLIVCWPIIILVSALIPMIALKGTMRDSVVERLRVE